MLEPRTEKQAANHVAGSRDPAVLEIQMEILGFRQEDLLFHARAALNFWERHGPHGPFLVEARVNVIPSPPWPSLFADTPPRFELWPPRVLKSEGLEAYVKDQAALWDVFNQLMLCDEDMRKRLR
jgi:hypothetical protein